jgi:bacterial/archaeal transporter family protein
MWILFSLAAAICAALVVVLSKAGIQKLDPSFVFGIESICICIVTWSLILGKHLQKQVTGIDRKVWLFILGAGILTALSSLFSFHSLKMGHASRTASFEKISLVLSAVLSIVFLKEKLNWQLGVGVLLMLAGVLFIAFSDTAK